MKCEICHLNTATKSINTNMDGKVRELFVCDSCARLSPGAGASGSSPAASLTDILFSIGMPVDGNDKIDDHVCPMCGTSRNEVREKRRLGCPKCYDVFTSDIRTFLSEQQPAVLHTGRSPGGEVQQREVNMLKTELGRAIAEERFEEAAALRDKIRHLTDGQATGDDNA